MSGLYIHIPFCKQACHYCNFHFSTSLKYRNELLNAIQNEIELQLDYLPEKKLQTIYLGGGTPSLLTEAELDQLFNTIFKHYSIEEQAELTLEANPDDLSVEYLKMLASGPINRLSIGIQSFSDDDLKYMNRAHDSVDAIACLDQAQSVGFQKISVDLIYGTPSMSDAQWMLNLGTLNKFEIKHISAYALTVEPKTALDHFIKSGKTPAPKEKAAARQFGMLMEWAASHNFLHYEISNFGQPGHLAIHNTNYWKGVPYLGIGPSAHSFNGISRQWNVSHNMKYIESLLKNEIPAEQEILSTTDRYNESVMTNLRTMWGCSPESIQAWGEPFVTYFTTQIGPHVREGNVLIENESYVLSNKGKLIADRIASDLFWVEDTGKG